MSNAPPEPSAPEPSRDPNLRWAISPANLAGLHPHVLAAIGSDFLAFCNAAERPFGRRSAKARAARSSLYAGAGVAMIASIVIKLLAIDRVLTWFPDWFPNLLLVISGLFTLGLVIKLDILDRTERIYRVEASEVTLKLLARRSTLAVSKEGYGFDLEDHDGFASVLGGPFPAETLMTHVRWRLGSFDFETVYSREEAMVPHPSFRRYLFRIDRRGDQTAPVFVVPANVDVPGLMEPPPGTNEPPLAVTYSIDLGDSEFARHFRCYSADAEGAAAAMHGVMRTALVALAGWMDTTRLRLVIDGDGILGVAGPFDDSVYAPREEGSVLDPDAALTVLLDLCIPLRLIDGLVAAETLSPATAAAI